MQWIHCELVPQRGMELSEHGEHAHYRSPGREHVCSGINPDLNRGLAHFHSLGII